MFGNLAFRWKISTQESDYKTKAPIEGDFLLIDDFENLYLNYEAKAPSIESFFDFFTFDTKFVFICMFNSNIF